MDRRPQNPPPLPPHPGLAVLHNELARCNGDLCLTAWRVLMLMANQVQENNDLLTVCLRVKDYQSRVGLRGESAYGHLETVVERLMRTIIRTPRPVGGVRRFQVLAPTDDDGVGEFQLRFNEDMRPLLLSLKALFCKIPLDMFFRIQGGYSVRFYLYAKSWAPGDWRMTVEELRAWLGFKAGKYESSFHLRAAVLERAKQELDEVADLSFDYHPFRQQGRVAGWTFVTVANRPKLKTRRGRRKTAPLPAVIPEWTPEQKTAIREELERAKTLVRMA